MRIALEHGKRLVAGDRRRFHRVQALLEQPARRLMAQIVEPEVLESSLLQGGLPMVAEEIGR